MVLQYRQVWWWSDSAHGFEGGGYLFGERMYQVRGSSDLSPASTLAGQALYLVSAFFYSTSILSYVLLSNVKQVQSLVSKSLLLWLVVGGSNQPNSYN
jgi:hypothetical protein